MCGFVVSTLLREQQQLALRDARKKWHQWRTCQAQVVNNHACLRTVGMHMVLRMRTALARQHFKTRSNAKM